ncbi:MAG: nitrogen fixation protein FixH [Gammaproteobacteria bacterium]|nr:MAG: nitrogen fixation protein FixH [Gammaproteobacteria bacterium]
MTPWYRQFWPWFLIALPASSVVAGFVTLWLAMRDPDGLVVDDYYREGILYNKRLERDKRAAALGIAAELWLHQGKVRVILKGPPSEGPLTLSFLNATRANKDKEVELFPVDAHTLEGEVGTLPKGKWYLLLEPRDETWWLKGVMFWPQQTHLQLVPQEE